MVLSYSAAAQPTSSTPAVISIASRAEPEPQSPQVESTPSSLNGNGNGNGNASASTSTSASPSNNIKHLILDAGPLLSLTPLRHLATHFHTTPAVVAELRDPKAREYWKRLPLLGVEVKVEQPSVDAMARVVTFAKKTGDYAVLSTTDLGVVALTCQYELEENGEENVRTEPGQRKGKGKAVEGADSPIDGAVVPEVARAETAEEGDEIEEEEGEDLEDDDSETSGRAGDEEEGENELVGSLTDGVASTSIEPAEDDIPPSETAQEEPTPLAEAESDEGEWITPSNIAHHRSHDLGLLPDERGAADAAASLAAACMTGDYAVQNVLLGMGLGLVGEGGKKISKVRSWVLRCHACFKICKDSSKRFCPSCGNPSLLRTTVSTSAKTGAQTIHLKKNFQYHLRGSKYTIPDAKPGRAKGQQKGGTGLILREDQAEWSNAVRYGEIKREKEERKVMKGEMGSWMDPDWMPEIITVGMSGKGRSGAQGMPTIGHGRKNPNQARRKR